jgi:hypothetical protein
MKAMGAQLQLFEASIAGAQAWHSALPGRRHAISIPVQTPIDDRL